MKKEKWFYDYANKCDCSDDDRCGCTYPENMSHDFNYVTEITEDEVHAQPIQNRVYVGGLAPDFTATAVLADNSTDKEFNLYNYIADKFALLLFYPADFSSMCPSELIGFNRAYGEFEKRGVKIVAVSVDSSHSHIAWKKLPLSEGGVGNIRIPLVSDICKAISFDYGVLTPDGTAQRASFIIDRNYVIRYQVTHDRQIGREVTETLRVIDVLQNLDKNGSICAAGWEQESEAFYSSAEGQAHYLQQE